MTAYGAIEPFLGCGTTEPLMPLDAFSAPGRGPARWSGTRLHIRERVIVSFNELSARSRIPFRVGAQAFAGVQS
jgi:hypothetical protein